MYKMKVYIYDNAVRILTYDFSKSTNLLSEHTIKIRFWELKKAKQMINDFHADNIISLHKKNIDWEYTEMFHFKWNFKRNQAE